MPVARARARARVCVCVCVCVLGVGGIGEVVLWACKWEKGRCMGVSVS